MISKLGRSEKKSRVRNRATKRRVGFQTLEKRHLLAAELDSPVGSADSSLESPDSEMVFWNEGEVEARKGQWVVQFDRIALADLADSSFSDPTIADALSWLDRRPAKRDIPSSGSIERRLYEFDDVLIRSAMLNAFANHPGVISVEPNYRMSVNLVPDDPSYSELWGLDNSDDHDIDAPEAWDLTTGTSDIVVGVIDTGVDYTHEDLADNIWVNPAECPAGIGTCVENGIDEDGNGYVDDFYGWDFYNNDNDPFDDNSHGTHVAGTIAAVGNNSTGVVGVNWNASLMALKFLGGGGSGFLDDAVSAIEYATMMKRDHGVNIRLTNNSWGGGGFSQTMYDAIAASQSADMLFVAAAGNDSANNDTRAAYPASYNLNNIISVASTTSSDGLSSFSNYGRSTVDLGAPGSSIYSTIPSNRYGTKSGTSMASPHVAGVAALAWGIDPAANYNQVRNAVLGGVDPVASLSGKTVTGGRLNAHTTLQRMGLFATLVSPEPNVILETAPTAFRLDFSDPINVGSVQASDLKVNEIAANGFVVVDENTIDFTYATSPVTVEGIQTIELAENSITQQSNGDGVSQLATTFFFDPTPLVVTSVTPSDGGILSLPDPSIRLDFSEAISPGSIGLNNLVLSDGRVERYTIVDDNTVIYHVAGIVNESVLSVDLAGGAVADSDGFPNRPFAASFPLDVTTIGYPEVWVASAPLGSGVRKTSISGLLHDGSDEDRYLIDLESGQPISFAVTPRTGSGVSLPGLRLRVIDPNNVTILDTSVASGNPIVANSLSSSLAGEHTVLVSSSDATSGGYELTMGLATILESETFASTSNNPRANAEDIEGGWHERLPGVRQLAVTASFDSGVDEDWYSFSLQSGVPATLVVAAPGMTQTGDGPLAVSIVDSSGATLVDGEIVGDNGRIEDWIPGLTGTYFARVSGGNSSYVLSVTTGATLDQDWIDLDRNGTPDQPQILELPPRVVGHVGGDFESGPGIDSTAVRSDTISLNTSPEGDMVRDLVYTPDGLRYLIAHRDSRNVLIYDAASGQVLAEVPVEGKPVDVEVTPDGAFALSANTDGDSVTVINLQSMTKVADIPTSSAWPYRVHATADSGRAIVATAEGQYLVISLTTMTEILQFEASGLGSLSTGTGFEFGERALIHYTDFVITPDGNKLIGPGLGIAGSTVDIFDLATGELIKAIPVPDLPPSLVMTADGSTVYAVSRRSVFESTISKIDLATDSLVTEIEGPGLTSNHVLLTPDEQEIIGGRYSSLEFIDLSDGSRQSVFAGDSDGFAISHDGRFVIARDVIDLSTKTKVGSLPWFSAMDMVVTSPTELRAFQVGRRATDQYRFVDTNGTSASILETRTGGAAVEGDSPVVMKVTADGLTAVTANRGSGNLSVVDLAGKAVVRWIDVGLRVDSLAITPDGGYAIASSSDSSNSVALVNLTTGVVDATLSGINFIPRDVAITRDGTKAFVVTTGMTDQPDSLYFISVEGDSSAVTGSIPIGDARGGSDEYTRLQLSPDGSLLAIPVTGSDHLVLVDTATNTEIARLDTGASSPTEVLFSPDGAQLFVRHQGSGEISAFLVDGASTTLQKVITGIPRSAAMVIDASGEYLYVATAQFFRNNEVHVVDAKSYDIIHTVSLETEAKPTRMYLDGNVIYLLASPEFEPRVFADEASDLLMRIFAAGDDSELVDKVGTKGRTRLVHYSPALQSAVTASTDQDHVEIFDFSQTTYNDEDYYAFLPQVGDTISLSVSTPGSDPGLVDNDLDVAIEVFDPHGQQIGFSSDGTFQFQATSIGRHTVRVIAQHFSKGEYVLSIDGATNAPGPSLIDLSPGDGSQDVAPDALLTLRFDEPVIVGSGQLTLRRRSDDSVFTSINASSNEIVIDGASVVVTPNLAWELGTDYYVLIEPGTFTGVGGEAFSGISSPTLWDFSVGFGFDFGDVPSPYPVTQAESGARHSLFGPQLGANRDSEADGVHSPAADADDAENLDDEDGTEFGSLQVGQLDASMVVDVRNVETTAYVDAWIDFNADGHFGGANEQIAIAVPVVEGSNTILFDIPSTIASGQTYARVRLSSSGGLGVVGNAPDGEVEDYLVEIQPPNSATTEFHPQARLTPNGSGGGTIVPTDLDGDGDMDLLYPKGSGNNAAWLENMGGGEYVERTLYADWHVDSLEAADFDGDGDMDVIFLRPISDEIGWYQNQGNETFIRYIIDDQLATPQAFSVADTNQDGDLDIVLVDNFDDVLLLYENDGNQSFTKQTLASSVDADLLEVADLDHDGDLDYLVNDDGLSWYEQTPTGLTQHVLAAGLHYYIDIADVNSDGFLDVVDAESFKVNWFENDGSGAFTSRLMLNNPFVRSVALGDIDGDGDTDAIAKGTNSAANLSWLENDGSENFLRRTLSENANQPADIKTTDFNGDGDLDVVFSSSRGLQWIENVNGILLSIEEMNPAPGSAMIDPSDPLSIRFDQPIKIGSGKVTIYRGDDDSFVEEIDAGSARVSIEVDTLTIDPATEFELDTDYYVVVDRGVVANLPGDLFEGFDIGQWGFRTVGTGVDYGDAPDESAGTGPGNYNTLASDDGPSNVISSGIFLGRIADGDDGTLQGPDAYADDVDGNSDDEDSIVAPLQDLTVTEGSSPTVSVLVTNRTEEAATLTGWIDYDNDGQFEASESTQIMVAAGTNLEMVTLTFPQVPGGSEGSTFARLRIGADATSMTPLGTGGAGEVEDHPVLIRRSGLGTPSSASRISSGVGGGPILDPSDQFGASIASIGDLNGDGIEDLAIAAPGDDDLSVDAGAIYIALMNADGTINQSQKITANFAGLPFDAVDRFGTAIAPAGDLDHDGVQDLYVLSQATGISGPSLSRVMLRSDGTVKNHTYNLVDVGTTFPQLTSFAPIGDLNGDGTTDFAFGDSSAGPAATPSGALYIMLTDQSGDARSWVTIGSEIAGGPELTRFEYFGTSVAALGDLDGDGIPDLAVGAYGNGGVSVNSGAVYLLMMNRDGTVKDYHEINGQGINEPTLAGLSEFGNSLSAIGDLNADGVTELLVGARGHQVGALTRAGQAFVLYLASDGSVADHTELATASGGPVNAAASSLFGTSVAAAGDLNGDGHVDLAVSSMIATESNRGTIHTILLEAPNQPGVDDIQVNDDGASRSQVTSLHITFDEQLDHQHLGQAFQLKNLDMDVDVGELLVTADDSSGKTVVRVGFAGNSTVARSGTGELGDSLADGNYRLVIDSTKILTLGGTPMVSDHVYGEHSADAFFRMFGDSDGDRDVDGQDYGRFGLTFLKQSEDPGYASGMDYDGDGDVDGQDYGQFGLNFLKQLSGPS